MKNVLENYGINLRIERIIISYKELKTKKTEKLIVLSLNQ